MGLGQIGCGYVALKGLASGDSTVTYGPGLCPVVKNLHQRTFLCLNLCAHTYTDPEIDQVVAVFRNVWAHLEVVA